MHELAETVDISIDRVHFILHHEKMVRTMGTMFAYSREKTKTHANVRRMFANVYEEFS